MYFKTWGGSYLNITVLLLASDKVFFWWLKIFWAFKFKNTFSLFILVFHAHFCAAAACLGQDKVAEVIFILKHDIFLVK